MLNRFNFGTIVDYETMEDVANTGIYVIDKNSGKIRRGQNADEYLTHQVVLVNDYNFSDCGIINTGSKCRCWHVYLVLQAIKEVFQRIDYE